MKKVLLLFILLWTVNVGAQVVTTSSANATQLAQSLVGPGVVVSNAVLTGGANTAGTFTATNSNLGLGSGVVLSTSYVASVPANSAAGINSDPTCSGCNDPDLLALAQQFGTGTTIMRDAVVLEFDVFVIADTLKFNYVFGSDEYTTFVCSPFNDAFGFFISGPGITGPYTGNSKNIALVPGTTTPVSINTINHGGGLTGNCQANSQFFNLNNATSNTVFLNGFTTVLEAKIPVQPCQTYRLRLKIADANDQSYDSAVFIEAGSLTSYGFQLVTSTSVGLDYPYAVEGCADGVFSFIPNYVDTVPRTVKYQIGGTATNGVDYTAILDSIVIPANSDSVAVVISPIADGIPEGTETVILYLLDPCFGNPVDSAMVEIVDSIPGDAWGDATICPGDSVPLYASGAVHYTWSPSGSLSSATNDTVWASPSSTTEYIVKMDVGPCSTYDTVTVTVNPWPPVDAGVDTFICIGGSTQFNASGGVTYSWSPPLGLSNSTIPNPIANPINSTSYVLTVFDSIGCSAKDTLHLEVKPLPIPTITPDTTICPATDFTLQAGGGIGFAWTPAAGLSDTAVANPIVNITAPANYLVEITDSFGCMSTAQVALDIYPLSDPMAAPDTSVCPDEPVRLSAQNGVTYSWTPAGLLDNASSATPTALTSSTTTFTVEIVDTNGCTNSDDVTVHIYPLPVADAGPDKGVIQGEAVTLNGSGGIQYMWSPVDYLNDPTIANPITIPAESITYTITVTDQNGCESTDTVMVTVVPPGGTRLPNAFSPNNDGQNDEFRVIYENVFSEFSFRIYDRWGQKVFETDDPDDAWDGTYNGDEAPVGVYIYVIQAVDAGNRNVLEQGNVTLLR